MSEHTDSARLEATRDAIRTGTAPRPRVEGERTNDAGLQALAVTTDAEAFELGPAGFALKAMALDLLDERAAVARLRAEVERLRGVVWDAYIEGAVHNSHDCVNWYKSDACAALALPTPAPEGEANG